MRHPNPHWAFIAIVILTGSDLPAEYLSVGPGHPYLRIEAALIVAHPGDTLLVHPPGDEAYERVALCVTNPRITIQAVNTGKGRVRLSGTGFDYNGRGMIPRAIVQFNKGADDCRLEGFEISGAHNESHNGAGIRINQANRTTVVGCDIHHNDMGIMSNGDGTLRTAEGQRIERCLIRSNGDISDPGFSHNLYLGGTSATLVGCEIHSSLAGHNVKSRCHRLAVLACYVHRSANREFDLVDDASYTVLPGSDAIFAGNIIVKSRECSGNRNLIHFGQDGGNGHDGILYLIHNTFVTRFISPVVDLSAAHASVQFYNNVFWDGQGGQKGQELVRILKTTGLTQAVSGGVNWISPGFDDSAASFSGLQRTYVADGPDVSPFADPEKGDFHMSARVLGIVDNGLVVPPQLLKERGLTLLQYRAPQDIENRPQDGTPDLGAYEWVAKPQGD